MASSHGATQGADSLSYVHSDNLDESSPLANEPTFEQRAEASGLGGPRYHSRNVNDTSGVTDSAPAPTPALAATDNATNSDLSSDTSIAAGTGDLSSTTPATAHSGSSHAADVHDADTPKGDSKAGRLMEKVGKSIHSHKLAVKGEEKREKAAGLH